MIVLFQRLNETDVLFVILVGGSAMMYYHRNAVIVNSEIVLL